MYKKPHIFYNKAFKEWHCFHWCLVLGTGNTPKEAYESYVERVRTVMGVD